MATTAQPHRTIVRWTALGPDAEHTEQLVLLLGEVTPAQWQALLGYSLPSGSGVFLPTAMGVRQLRRRLPTEAKAPAQWGQLVGFERAAPASTQRLQLWGTVNRWLERWFFTQGPMLDPRLASCQRAHWHCDCLSESVVRALHRGRLVGADVLPEAWSMAHDALGRRFAGALPREAVALPRQIADMVEQAERMSCGRGAIAA